MLHPPGGSGPCILIGEDDSSVCSVLEVLLEDEGYRLVVASDGHDALTVAERERPDLILIDLGMPRLDGEGFCRAYRAGGGPAPVVLITAAGAEVVAAAMTSCDAVAYIPKPFDINHVLEIVSRFVGRAVPGGL
jgi:two-component system, chemotaxis family, chemotaxis protein CheY